jgi:ankyrin repeat protein
MAATMEGHTAIVKKLLERGIDSAAKNAALVSAVINNRTGIVRLLVEYGAEVNARDPLFGRTPLMYATSRTSEEITELLVVAGAALIPSRPKDPNGQ